MKPKILIIGGGVGGLSCATSLAETGKFDISIYESDIIGGQASTKKSKLCNTEISWRVFLNFYYNLFKIIDTIGAKNNFYSLKDTDYCISNKYSGRFRYTLINRLPLKELVKFLNLFLISTDRAINDYHNITAIEYFNNNELIKMLIGPYYGLDVKKATLSSFYKFSYNYFENYGSHKISKFPTSDSLFIPWNKYLESLGVKIYEKHFINKIITDKNGKIKKVIINNGVYEGNEIIFANSTQSLVDLFNKNNDLNKKIICKKLNILNTGRQYYISVNFYWKRPIITTNECHIYTFANGWLPIILKRFINTDYVEKNCNKNIKEVWNISLADNLLGNYVKKYTSQCSFEEIVYEIKMNIINSEHFKNYFDFENNTWDDYFYDYEFDDRYEKQLPTAYKFSINKGIETNLLNNQEPELGNNIYFSAYYVKNTTGGAGMETSCEIGLTTADLICKKYNIKNPRKPILRTKKYLTLLTSPLVLFDSLLYSLKMRPITDFINPLILLIIYFIIILIFIKIIITFSKKKLRNIFNLNSIL